MNNAISCRRGLALCALIVWLIAPANADLTRSGHNDIAVTIVGMVLGLMFFRSIKAPAAGKPTADDS